MFSEYFDMLLQNLNSFIEKKYQPLMDDFYPFFLTLLTLFIIVFGFKLLRGDLGKETVAGVKALVMIIFVTNIIFKFEIYNYWIIEPLIQFILNLTSFFVSVDGYESTTSVFSSVDSSFSAIFNKVAQVIEDTSWMGDTDTKLGMYLLSLLGGILYILFSVLMMLGIFAAYLFLSIGGITLFFLSFQTTKFITIAWFRGLMNFALLPVFTGLVMGITLHMLDGAMDKFVAIPPDEISIFSRYFGGLLFIIIVSSYFHLKVPDFTSGLTGGSPTSMGGVAVGGGLAAAAGFASNRYVSNIPIRLFKKWKDNKKG